MRYRRGTTYTVSDCAYGVVYICDHPIYNRCTLYEVGNRGLAVIQQRISNKRTWWCEIDKDLVDAIYLNEHFYEVFNIYAKERDENGLYPTLTVRQLMWSLRMKPLPKQQWETYFDKKPI